MLSFLELRLKHPTSMTQEDMPTMGMTEDRFIRIALFAKRTRHIGMVMMMMMTLGDRAK